jgi:dihydrofolate synthase/folylpolyglutamate synthase
MNETLSSCCLPADAPFHSYEDVMRHLDSLGLFHMDMGLGRMERALEKCGITRFHCPAVQVVGTNGKGSTSSFLQSLAMAHGISTALYTSPHFVFPEERIRLDRTMLPRRVWPRLAGNAVLAQPGLTYFELLTVMAADAFQDSDCGLMIFEAGLGGRYDATSTLPVDMVCFVPIDLDHTAVLGSTVQAIADDKSDALRPGVCMAVSAPQPREARAVLEAKADARGIPLCSAPSPFSCAGTDAGQALWSSLPSHLRELAVLPEDAELGLRGPHQRMNAQTALLAWILLCHQYGWKTDRAAIARGLAEAFIPGRLQYAPARGERPALWLDGAHNPHGMTALLSALADAKAMPEALRPGAVVFSCLGDKEPEQMAALLAQASALLGNVPVFVPPIADNPRAAAPAELAALLRQAREGQTAAPAESMEHALSSARHAAGTKPILVCGSLYLVSEIFALWPELLSPAQD